MAPSGKARHRLSFEARNAIRALTLPCLLLWCCTVATILIVGIFVTVTFTIAITIATKFSSYCHCYYCQYSYGRVATSFTGWACLSCFFFAVAGLFSKNMSSAVCGNTQKDS